MHKRRINTPRRSLWYTPMAALTAVALLTAAAFNGHQILRTQEFGTGPVPTTLVETSFADGATTIIPDPAVATQGEDAEIQRAVKEFHRDEPFSQFALAWEGERDLAAFVRAKQADGSWSPWYDMELISSPGLKKNGTEPAFLGSTTDVQVSVSNVDLFSADAGALEAVFIDGNAQEGIAPVADLESSGMPVVVSRAGWGADESIRCLEPTYDGFDKAITLHHTAGTSNYTPAQAAAQVRGIYRYHAQTLGWCDIGYNVLVDKYGTLYEGRYGGLNRAVQGAHVGGFNQNNWSISMLGDYSLAEPSQPMLESVAEIAGWKAAMSGFDPAGNTTLVSGGFRGSRYSPGTTYSGPRFLGHRDLHFTECPGENTVKYWPQLRANAQLKYLAITAGAVLPISEIPGDDSTDDDAAGGNAAGGNAAGKGTTGGTKTQTAETQDEQTSTAGGSSMKKSTANTLIGIAIAVSLVGLYLHQQQQLQQSVDNKSATSPLPVADIISQVVALTGNPELRETWTAVINTFGPVLGFPVGGPNLVDPQEQLTYQLFSNGVVLSSQDTGTHALIGEFAKQWAQRPQELGLPLSDPYPVAGNQQRMDFQGGHLVLTP